MIVFYIHNADVFGLIFQALEIQFIHDDVKRGLTIHYYAKYTILTWENLKGSDLMLELFKKDFVLGYLPCFVLKRFFLAYYVAQ